MPEGEKPVAIVEFETDQAQAQFVNSGVMDLEFTGEDQDTIAFVLAPPPQQEK